VELAIAGPGSRSYAFIIDWHIRILLALTWILGATLVQFRGCVPAGESMGPAAVITLAPAAAIYFLTSAGGTGDAWTNPRQAAWQACRVTNRIAARLRAWPS